MVEFEVDGLLEAFARALYVRGISLDAFMSSEDLDGPALRQRFHEQAERNLTVRLGLDAVAQVEGLEVTEQDRTAEVERLAERADKQPEEVTELLDERGDWSSVDGDILRAKALDLLVDRAAITEEGSS
jgi:trigger factor